MAETTRARRFWGAQADRDVEVTLTEPGLFASGRPAVTQWSAFEMGEEIACPRFCVDPTYRRPCRPAEMVVLPLGQRWW
jgi:hypothetical protein